MVTLLRSVDEDSVAAAVPTASEIPALVDEARAGVSPRAAHAWGHLTNPARRGAHALPDRAGGSGERCSPRPRVRGRALGL